MNHKRCLVKLNFVGGASWQFIVLGCLCVWFLSCNKIITDFISVYKDKSFSFITKVPPVAVLIKKALNIQKGSGKPNMDKVAKITKEQVKAIAEQKMEDLNAASVEAAMKMVAGTARSMGVVVVD